MKYIKIFETYKAQKEIEKLADKFLRKIAEKTYEYNHKKYGEEMDLSGEFWKKKDFNPEKLVNKKVRLKEPINVDGFIKNASYLISYADDERFRFYGYNYIFEYGEVGLVWDKRNKQTFNNKFIGVSLDELENDYIELKEFCKTFDLYTIVEFRKMNHGATKGTFQPTGGLHGTITVNIPEYIKNSIMESAKEEGKLTKDILYFKLFSSGYSTLIHELQHAYDYYRSGGRAMDSQFDDKKYHQELKKRREIFKNKQNPSLEHNPNSELSKEELNFINSLEKKYLNFPHEVNARFTQALKNTSFWDVDIDMENDGFVYNIKDIHTAFKDFKRNMGGWNALTPKHKKALSRRFSQFWHFEKDFIEEKNRS